MAKLRNFAMIAEMNSWEFLLLIKMITPFSVMITRRYSSLTLILLAIIFSFLIRIWQLDTNPTGFFVDETLGGYEAWNLINFGHDSHGEKFPLFFKSLNSDNLSPFNTYLPLPFIAVFGLNEFAIRLTAVTFSLIGLFVFYLTLKQFISSKLALVGMIMLSISPWYFHISRIHINDPYAWVLLVNVTLLFLFRGFKTGKSINYILAGLSLGLASYSYFPSRFISPILFLVLLLIILLQKKVKVLLTTFLVFILILLPFIFIHLTDSNSFKRMQETILPKYNSSKIIEKYLAHFSDDFLFQKGDANFPGQFMHRHSINGMGLLHPYQKWLIILGLIWALVQIYNKKNYSLIFVVAILLISPIPDSLTSDSTPFATRSYLEILPLGLFSSFGIFTIFQLIDKFKSRSKHILKVLFSFLIIILIVISTLNLLDKFVKNPLSTSDFWGWQYGPRDIMKYFLSVKANYDDLYMSGEFNAGHIFLKFYDPKNTCESRCKMGDFFREPKIVDSSRRQLFSLSPEYLSKSSYSQNFKVVKTIYYPNGNIAFLIGEIKQNF